MPLPDYVPTDWVDDVTLVNAVRMDNIDTAIDGIVGAHNALETRVAAEEAQPDIPPVQNGKWLTGAGGALVWADAPTGGGGAVDYENAWNVATPYTAGDVVNRNGVEYLAVNPSTGVTPPAPAAPPLPVGVIPLVTALPTALFDGQECILCDSLTTPTFSWRLRYVAAKPNNKWMFVGGAPLFAEVATQEAAGSLGSYIDLPTVGPSITIPVAGSYIVEIVATPYQGTGSTDQWMSYAIGATAAVDADGVNSYNLGSVGETNYMVRSARKTLTAVTLTAKYKVIAATASFKHRTMKVTPVAVGG